MTAPLAVSSRLLEQHLRVLTLDIGVRLAGSEPERQAADYAAGVLRSAGASVTVESFPVFQRCVDEQTLEVFMGGAWRSFQGSLFSSTPGTAGAWVEAPLVFFEAPTEYAREDLSFLRGKAVVHLGCHIESRDAYRRLMQAEPAFLLFVDIRYPGTTPLADGMFPSYTKDLGAKPTLNLSFLASVGSVSPYVGLFGTVWGIMHAFVGLAALTQVTLATVAPVIAEALVATAIGLFAAIPAVVAYNRFARDIDRIATQQETFIEEFSNILQRNVGAQPAQPSQGR